MTADSLAARHLRRVVLVVAALNFGHFFVEFGVALAAGSVSLLADSVDFLEDTAINLLIAVARAGHWLGGRPCRQGDGVEHPGPPRWPARKLSKIATA